jgi:hypothetical protein
LFFLCRQFLHDGFPSLYNNLFFQISLQKNEKDLAHETWYNFLAEHHPAVLKGPFDLGGSGMDIIYGPLGQGVKTVSIDDLHNFSRK